MVGHMQDAGLFFVVIAAHEIDYSEGVDISRYKNIPVPTSYMAYHSDYDFVGGYDYKEEAGILHVSSM